LSIVVGLNSKSVGFGKLLPIGFWPAIINGNANYDYDNEKKAMANEQLEYYKGIAAELSGVFEKYSSGLCSYDRALEDAAYKLKEAFNKHPVAGYVQSGELKKVLLEVYGNKKQNEEESYIFDCKVHRNKMDTIERILKRL
jgi:hypothetical protein